jgi:Ca2+/Na+ antiporter
MAFLEILVIALAAIIIGSLFFFVFKTAGPWGSFWIFILILILAGLAAAAWIRPFGPVYWNVSWVPVLFVIVLFSLFIAALTPTRRERDPVETEQVPEPQSEDAAMFTLSFFFWAFIVFLLAAVIWGFLV